MSVSATKLAFDDAMMWLDLADGRRLGVPLANFPRLLKASPEARMRYELSGGGTGIHWEELDEDISVFNLLCNQMAIAPDSDSVCYFSVTGFIDLLGTKDRIAHIETAENPEEQCQRLGEATQDVRKFRDDFELTLRASRRIEAKHDALCPEEQRPLRNSLKGNPTRLHTFSDTVIIHTSLAAVDRKVPLGSVWEILAATAIAQLYSLARRVPARGGIELGMAAEVVPGEIFGPAAYRALMLEEQAIWPRIALGKKLCEYIDFHASMAPGSPEDVANWQYANLCKELVCIDSAGLTMLDIRSVSLECLMPDSFHQKCIEKAKRFAAEREALYRTQGNAKLAGVYAVLSSYLG